MHHLGPSQGGGEHGVGDGGRRDAGQDAAGELKSAHDMRTGGRAEAMDELLFPDIRGRIGIVGKAAHDSIESPVTLELVIGVLVSGVEEVAGGIAGRIAEHLCGFHLGDDESLAIVKARVLGNAAGIVGIGPLEQALRATVPERPVDPVGLRVLEQVSVAVA